MSMLDFAIMATTEYIGPHAKKSAQEIWSVLYEQRDCIFMAGLFEIPIGCEALSILDPGAGSGILSIALLEACKLSRQ